MVNTLNYEEVKKEADAAKVVQVAERVEEIASCAPTCDKPWLERASKLLRRWGIDLT